MGIELDRRPGPVDPPATDWVALRPLGFGEVRLDPDGLLGEWQTVNRRQTVPHCIAQVEKSGALDNLRRLIGASDAPFRGMRFQDSDLYKTLEAVSWVLEQQSDPDQRAFLNSAAELLAAAQDQDGYLNSWFQGVLTDQRWRDLPHGHEMYCAGHLIQAAVAAARVANHQRLLEVARRFADLLVERFGVGGEAAVCGHPEIETALVELTRLTGEEAYAALAARMIDLRGHGLLGDHAYGRNYFQDHLPVREAVEATGHAVRQLYLAAGVTDVYLQFGDRSLLDAMERLWHDTFAYKTYLTGGHGSRHRAESFGDPYELPPDRAYTETCAAIASFQWNWRLLLATGHARYADEMERALYNAIAVSVSADGQQFFYSNPLQLRMGHDGTTEDAPSERLPWYACACCPPNLARLVGSLHHYVATQDESGIQIQLFASGRMTAVGPFGAAVCEVRTDYPWSGRVSVRILESDGRPWTLSVRMPGWCERVSASLQGVAQEVGADDLGYLRLTSAWRPGAEVVFDFEMPTRLVHAHPHVDSVRGCAALVRGPLVYCVEELDLEPGVLVDDLVLDPNEVPQPVSSGSPLLPMILRGRARVVRSEDGRLYQTAAAANTSASTTLTSLQAIPYYRWANRGVTPMRVWLPVG